MKKLVLSGLCLAGLCALPDTVNAHGGQYRGPGDVVPPSPGGGRGTGGPGGPTTGGPSGPSAPGPSGPTTPGASGPATGGPSGPGGGGAASTGQRGMQISDDLTRWEFWWEFNKDPFIRLREAVISSGPKTGSDDFYLGAGRKSDAKDSLRPTQEQIMGEILPVLKRSLDDTLERDFDIISSCLVAMAKVGKDHQDFKLYDVFRTRLTANNQEIRETAALALGIAGPTGMAKEQFQLLADLVANSDAGKKASEASQVNERTRSFAAYGLGLASYLTADLDLKRQAFEALKPILDPKAPKSDRNLRVAAIHGISLLKLGTDRPEETKLLDEAVAVLEEYYTTKMGAGDQLIQAHCATAIAKLIGRNHPRADHFKAMFAKDLERKNKDRAQSRDIQRSAALALGQLVRPNNSKDKKDNPDHEYNKLLLDSWHDSKDQQTKFFSILALGQIGGELNRSAILKEFDKAKTLEKPWCALALGVYSFFKYEEQKSGGSAVPEELIGETLYDAFRKEKNPNLIGSLAVALGLNKYTEAADAMRSKMLQNVQQEAMAGYLCIGLALMNDTTSILDISRVVDEATRRPELLQQAAIALGKLGDKKVADQLRRLMVDEGGTNLAKLSAIASALGFIGDQRSVTPLKQMLDDTSISQLSRAFAAVALGGVADKELLPWNSKIAVNTNYRAAVETLTNQTSGILDIL